MPSNWAQGNSIYGVQSKDEALGPMDLAMKVRVKAMHHWIRKGEANKAAARARDLAHSIHAMWRKNGAINRFS